MSNQKSKPIGTIHVRTTPASMKTANAPDPTNSAIPALETSSAATDQDSAAPTATGATAITADSAPGSAPVESSEIASIAAVPESSPAETAPDKSASNATTPPAPATVPMQPAPEAARPKTKMAIATEIFERMKKGKGVTRKEIIDQFVAEAKLSKAGASTYYQLVKSKSEKK
jgi:hypothetical protein